MEVPDVHRHGNAVTSLVGVPDDIEILQSTRRSHRYRTNGHFSRGINALNIVIYLVVGLGIEVGHDVILPVVVDLDLIANEPYRSRVRFQIPLHAWMDNAVFFVSVNEGRQHSVLGVANITVPYLSEARREDIFDARQAAAVRGEVRIPPGRQGWQPRP